MMKFFTQVFRYPLAVFVATMEALAGAVREIQKTTDQTINAMVGGDGHSVGAAPGGQTDATNSQVSGGVTADGDNQTTIKEESRMSDQDLGGADLKYVSYSILFNQFHIL